MDHRHLELMSRVFRLPTTRRQRFWGPKTRSFLKNGPQSGDFENAGFPFKCGLRKTDVLEYDNVYTILLVLRMLFKE